MIASYVGRVRNRSEKDTGRVAGWIVNVNIRQLTSSSRYVQVAGFRSAMTIFHILIIAWDA